MKQTLLSFIFLLFTCAISAQSSSHKGQAENLNVYPNPVVKYFKVGYSDRVQTMSLVNMAGRVVKRFDYNNGVQYNIEGLHRGVYLLQLRDVQNRVVRTLRLTKR